MWCLVCLPVYQSIPCVFVVVVAAGTVVVVIIVITSFRPHQPTGKTWTDHYIQVANRTLWPASTPEVNWHHGLCSLRLQRSRTDNPPHPPRLPHLGETETPVMAKGWVNYQQAVGNDGRPAHQKTAVLGPLFSLGIWNCNYVGGKIDMKPLNLFVNDPFLLIFLHLTTQH